MRTISICLGFLLAACQTAPFVWVDDLTSRVQETESYRIHAGDRVDVNVYKQTDLSVSRTVRADGRVTLPLLGDVAVLGLTPQDAASEITRRLQAAELVLDPKVTVAVDGGGAARFITVLGEVKNPGRYELAAEDSLLEIIGKAGGLTEFAATDDVYLVREGHEPPRIRFSYARVSRGLGRGLSFRFHDGDVVVAE